MGEKGMNTFNLQQRFL